MKRLYQFTLWVWRDGKLQGVSKPWAVAKTPEKARKMLISANREHDFLGSYDYITAHYRVLSRFKLVLSYFTLYNYVITSPEKTIEWEIK